MVKYADGPTVEVDVLVTAPIERVWVLVSDIELPARFSSEFLGARWIDDDQNVSIPDTIFASRAVDEPDAADDVHLPQLHRPAPFPPLVVRPLPLAAPAG